MVKINKNNLSKIITKHKNAKHCKGECKKDFLKLLNKRISSRSGKNKGARLQNKIGKRLADRFNLTFGKDEDIQGREMGQSGVDIRMSKEAKNKIPFDIEAKNAETWTIPAWWEQTTKNTKEDRIPLLIVSKNNYSTLAIIDFEDLISLIIKNKNK